MIDLIQSKPPSYKGETATPSGAPGFLSGLWCYLFGGGAAPAYRDAPTSDGVTAPTVSRCWWSLTGTPEYRTPPAPPPSEPDPTSEPCDGEPVEEDCPCETPIGREIHIYPAE